MLRLPTFELGSNDDSGMGSISGDISREPLKFCLNHRVSSRMLPYAVSTRVRYSNAMREQCQEQRGEKRWFFNV